MADRHVHTGAKTFLARWTAHYLDVLPRQMAKWGIPPGEDMIHEPHAPLTPYKKGDSDIQRHHDAFGHLVIAADSDYQALGGWTTEQAVGAARILKDWIVEGGKKIGSRNHIREYLRWGNYLNTIAGVYDVFTAYGYSTEAQEALNIGRAAVYMMYPAGWSTTIEGNVGTMTFTGWNYGELEVTAGGDAYIEPFNYGWRKQTSQPWYDGHQVIGLYNLALRFIRDSTSDGNVTAATSTYFTGDVEAGDAAFQKCVAVVDHITRWYAYDSRKWAPMGDQSAHGAADFVNAKSHGCKYGTATEAFIIANDDATLMSLADWHGYSEDTAYYRCHTLDYHEADGKYYELLYTDTVNPVRRGRKRDRGLRYGFLVLRAELRGQGQQLSRAGHDVDPGGDAERRRRKRLGTDQHVRLPCLCELHKRDPKEVAENSHHDRMGTDRAGYAVCQSMALDDPVRTPDPGE
jgi:hypothetical protein